MGTHDHHNEIDYSYETEHDHGRPGHGGSPGKAPTTARLAGRPQTNIIFRVADAASATALGNALAPRDSNGVAASAPDAVDRASSSGGNPLPADLRERFEESLGADLSGVRIHTDSASAEASKAVGARAYTTGQDVHFNDGQYNPIDPFGVHLLAHEVAHTVQQQSSGPIHRQHKLEVSSPGDSFEVEADRAADAMVVGRPASVSPIGSMPLSRDPLPGDPNYDPRDTRLSPHSPREDQPGAPHGINPLTGQPNLPPPINWAGSYVDGDLVGGWSGAPSFLGATAPLGGPGLQWWQEVQTYKEAFSSVWTQAQGGWSSSVSGWSEYKEAAADAESKGLADFEGSGFDVDLDADGEDFGHKGKTVSEAFQRDQEMGLKEDGKAGTNETFDRSKVDAATIKAIRAKKVELKTFASSIRSDAEAGIDTSKDSLNTAVDNVNTAIGALSISDDVKAKKQLEVQKANMQRSAALCKSAITVMSKLKPGNPVESAIGMGTAALDLINTAVWDSQIAKIESSIQMIDGGIAAFETEKLGASVRAAQRAVAASARAVKAAVNKYKQACATYKTRHAELAELLGKAAEQSNRGKANAGQIGERVKMAVEAIPVMERALQACSGLKGSISVPAESDAARRGGGLCTNSGAFLNHVGIMNAMKDNMNDNVKKWTSRLKIARKLINQAS